MVVAKVVQVIHHPLEPEIQLQPELQALLVQPQAQQVQQWTQQKKEPVKWQIPLKLVQVKWQIPLEKERCNSI